MANDTASDTERVYGAIRQAIVEGRYPPGGRLVEQRVAEELDVSRTPVREALRRLESEGLVVVERNRGAHVRPVSESEVADLYEVRARLEAYGAELAARRADHADVVALHQAAADFDDAVTGISIDLAVPQMAAVRALVEANARFHDTLLATGRHSRIRHLVAGAVDAPLVFRAMQRFTDGELHRSALFHHLIADAVTAAEPERAGRLMTEHVLQGRDALLGQLAEGDGVADLFAERTA